MLNFEISQRFSRIFIPNERFVYRNVKFYDYRFWCYLISSSLHEEKRKREGGETKKVYLFSSLSLTLTLAPSLLVRYNFQGNVTLQKLASCYQTWLDFRQICISFCARYANRSRQVFSWKHFFFFWDLLRHFFRCWINW